MIEHIIDAVLWLDSSAKIVVEPSGRRQRRRGARRSRRTRSDRGDHQRRQHRSGAARGVPEGGTGMTPVMADRTLRDGAHAVDVGEPRRVRHERERRAAADAARARRHGIRSRRVPRSASRLQPVERHRGVASSASARTIRDRRSIRSRSPTARRKRITSSR